MMPEFVYFDLDNTLLDHTTAEEEAHKEIYQAYPELQKVSVSEWLQTYKEINHVLWLQYQKGQVDRHQLHYSRFSDSMAQLGIRNGHSEEIGARYMEIYRKHWHWIEGAKEALEKVAEKYPVGFITNGFEETQRKKIEVLGLEQYSDIFIISEEIGVMKPHPKVFDLATEKSGTPRNRILYVGDSYSSDITGGKNAGWKTAWYTAFISEIKDDQTADFMFNKFPRLIDYLS
jgi:YjjG family noncanonical pyrimidine nucleotidase